MEALKIFLIKLFDYSQITMRGVCVQEAINIETFILLPWIDGYNTGCFSD